MWSAALCFLFDGESWNSRVGTRELEPKSWNSGAGWCVLTWLRSALKSRLGLAMLIWFASNQQEYLGFKARHPQVIPDDPPAEGKRPTKDLPNEFVSYEEYFDLMYPLLLIDLWSCVVREWEVLRYQFNIQLRYQYSIWASHDPFLLVMPGISKWKQL